MSEGVYLHLSFPLITFAGCLAYLSHHMPKSGIKITIIFHIIMLGKATRALLLTHGWPGSVFEFYKLLPMLTDPISHGGSEEDAFEVICPSIPGYGFSEAAHQPGKIFIE